MTLPPDSKSVALIVGAGGPTGGPFIHAALERIEELTGWVPAAATTIVGTSAGAFVAAWVEGEPSATSDAHFERLTALANGRALKPSFRHRLATVVRRGGGRLLAAITPLSRPDDGYRVPPRPYHPGAKVVTVTHRRGARVVWDLANAAHPEAVVRASAAVPGVNRPVEIDGIDHVDGAVYSAANVDAASVLGHDAILVVAPMIPRGGGPIVGRLHRAQLRSELGPWLADGKPAVVIMPDEGEHEFRRDRHSFEGAGALAVDRLYAASPLSRDNGHKLE